MFFASHKFRLWWRWSLILLGLHFAVFLTTGFTAFTHIETSVLDLLVFPAVVGLILWGRFDKDCHSFCSFASIFLIMSIFIGIKGGVFLFAACALVVLCSFTAIVIFVALFGGICWLWEKSGFQNQMKKLKTPNFLKKTIDFMLDR